VSQSDDEGDGGDEDEDDVSNVEKWLRTAPSVAEIVEAGRTITAPNELVVRIYGAACLFPPQKLVRKGRTARFFEENLKPAAVLHAERVYPTTTSKAAAAAPQPVQLGNFLGNDAARVAMTRPRGEQGPIAKQMGGSGWCSEAGLLLDRTGRRGVVSARGSGSDGSALSPAWAEQFTFADDRFVEAKLAVAADAATKAAAAALAAAGKRKKKKRPGDDEYVGGAWSREGGGDLRLRVCIAHWPAVEAQEAEAKRRKKPRSDGKQRPLSLNQPIALGAVEIPVDLWTHPSTQLHPETGELMPKPPIPATGGDALADQVPKEFRAWLPVLAPSKMDDAREAGPERREVERMALQAGLMAKAGGRPPKKDDPESLAALAPTPPFVPAGGTADPKVAKAAGGGSAKAQVQAWEDGSQEVKPSGFKEARRFLEAEKAERGGEDFNLVFVKAMEAMAAAAASKGRRGASTVTDDAANDSDGSDSTFDEDGDGGASVVVGFDDDEEEDPLLGHPVHTGSFE